MAEVNISINGRPYDISCDNGQEARVAELAGYINQRLQRVARGGGAESEAHLFVLAMLVLTDELFDERARAADRPLAAPARTAAPSGEEAGLSKADEQALARALSSIAKRLDGIAARVQAA